MLTLFRVSMSFAVEGPKAASFAYWAWNDLPLLLKVFGDAAKPLRLHQTPIAIVAEICGEER